MAQANNASNAFLKGVLLLVIATPILAFGTVFVAKRVIPAPELPAPTPIVADAQNANYVTRDEIADLVAVGIARFIQQSVEQEREQRFEVYQAAPAVSDKHIYGNPNARFTLVEFSDLECPFCKRFHSTPKQIVDASNGNVNWQWKHLPLEFHNPAALKEAHAAECIAEQLGNRAFWVFIEEIFNETAGNGQGITNLLPLVQNVGGDEGKFRECMNSNRHMALIQADMQQAAQNGITGTPATYIVDNMTGNRQLVSGAQPIDAYAPILRAMMEATK
jgi:protein-disulfide isomerase